MDEIKTTTQYSPEPVIGTEHVVVMAPKKKSYSIAIVVVALIVIGSIAAFILYKKHTALPVNTLQQLKDSSDTIDPGVSSRSTKLQEVSHSSSATSIPVESRRAMLNSLK